MNEKKRRDITLGEMQDACVAYDCDKCDPCFKSLCALMTNELGEMKAPKFWNLTDPPRFNEAQMALLNGLWDSGARKMIYHPDIDNRWIKFEREDRTMIACVDMKVLGYEPISGSYEHNLLAELLGKDGDK